MTLFYQKVETDTGPITWAYFKGMNGQLMWACLITFKVHFDFFNHFFIFISFTIKEVYLLIVSSSKKQKQHSPVILLYWTVKRYPNANTRIHTHFLNLSLFLYVYIYLSLYIVCVFPSQTTFFSLSLSQSHSLLYCYLWHIHSLDNPIGKKVKVNRGWK